jgi:hypothetical protein
MKDNVCSPKTAKQLKKIGIPQDAFFSWYKKGEEWILSKSTELALGDDTFSAFTASEASNHYPEHVWLSIGNNGAKRREAIFYFAKIKEIYKATLMVLNSKTNELVEIHREEDENEGESRSRLLLYLEKEANISNQP